MHYIWPCSCYPKQHNMHSLCVCVVPPPSLQEASQHGSRVRSMGEQEREAQSRQAEEGPGPERVMEDLGPDEPDLSTLRYRQTRS